MVLPAFMRVILSNVLIYYFMDECRLYSALLELKSPWEVERVSLDSVKKTVVIYIAHGKTFHLPAIATSGSVKSPNPFFGSQENDIHQNITLQETDA